MELTMAALTSLNSNCLSAIFLLLCYNSGYLQAEGKRFTIVDIKSHVNPEKIGFKSYIHENNTTFDMFVTLIKPLRTHDLLMITPLTLSQLACPLRPGVYNFTNLMVNSNSLVNTLDLGYYRFYIDVAQVSSAAVKLMDLQITTINQL
ncbi:unnamed protein product [Ceratitis capitata]|uniref:(Mediterranean fruit fly) hypothetical protein n=1 Tax=Ceratitis capitata TaxID=7213 RepID=A0A811UDN6_CERCA|nr:unnamed protein product [Ceratitis capitata]